ncbi:Coproporphyrinogen-III oxidase HemN (oxygen-independent) or related Fe-S oxidoreductase (HemN) (PDB:1OLT) [Commensalibacter communis]|uniref:Heme chaperone HemW n=1 Tax=Commensalibacter communis TaxID=2972786 RepID=A0A9W4TP98_9PROT|nr:radical SAM family heme chaperone HemW [Commensalibacter communis]CAI3951387.1 Coproporphyrinogen-III oxidase HemN (oxygen-independent) or related Fe-S oxidoreductase (HemN) (PDB:1OLT) [Commensalibacter communis]CAI3957561.1 Coproporphyrinogen-III oxidase HemN (oxygen-independent) or related Fe-S oxidoreductase (HemN) (PDB:1OLT) [Commensalibacter communis]CAI3957720.1 Coproporphyrinogen-III oxidase HemN (oxygen-independent) or related Fe-S oxidoreductase (HemN) (PDB:1OLT) [Commensalibacter co
MKATIQHTQQGIGLYIHWPFCLAKCPYCDFNSYVAEQIPQEAYAKALVQELQTTLAEIPKVPLTSIFFGGGTPSLMLPSTAQRLIDTATSLLPVSENLEITLEANPTSVENQKLKDFYHAGVNRASLGIQSLNPTALKALGREHSVGQAIEALTIAKKIFPRISFDLIYAREGQTIQEWEGELQEALALTHDHLSLYQLTIEPGTIFAKQYRQGKITLPDEELSTAMLTTTEMITNQYGLQAYEISNYAKPGAESRHNLTYWKYKDYIGIGPGAHGRVTLDQTLYATERHKNPVKWLEHVQQNGHALSVKEALTPAEKAQEMLLMGLRLIKGVQAQQFERRCGMALTDAVNMSMLSALVEENFLSWDQECLKTTPQGRLRLNAILEALLK